MTNPTLTDPIKTDSEAARCVVTECDLPEAPEKVWKALTLPELLAGWLPDAVRGEILTAEPNRLLSRRWPASEQDKDAAGRPLESVVTFELTGTPGGGTHLRVVHRVLSSSARVIPFNRGARKAPTAALAARTTAVTMLLRRAA